MSSDDSFIDYLDDMLRAIEKANHFISDMSYKEFKNDEKTIFAVIRALEILGEASNKIPAHIQKKFPEVPWRQMKGMRNKLVHDYMGVNIEVVWKTTTEDLPELQKSIHKMKELWSE